VRVIAQIATLSLVVLVIVAGFIGDETPTRNLAPITVWVIWWVGFAYLSALIGDVWAAVRFNANSIKAAECVTLLNIQVIIRMTQIALPGS